MIRLFFPKHLSCVLICQGLNSNKKKEDCLDCFLEHLQRIKRLFPEYKQEINSIIEKFTSKIKGDK